MTKYFFAIFLSLCMSACATPSGKLTKDDFVWRSVDAPMPYGDAYKRMAKGFNSEGMYIIEGNVFADSKTGRIDIYLVNPLWGRSQFVYGRVDILAQDDKSKVDIGFNNAFPGGNEMTDRWSKYLELSLQ